MLTSHRRRDLDTHSYVKLGMRIMCEANMMTEKHRSLTIYL